MDALERFLAVMEYQAPDRVPNWELGVWPQTLERWEAEGPDPNALHWDWFAGEAALGMDAREFIRFDGSFIPPFEEEVLEEDDRTVTYRDGAGRVRRALKEGAIRGGRASMDTYLQFPVATMQDWNALKRRLEARCVQRYEPNWPTLRVESWRGRRWPLIFAPNCATRGFYWFARDLMGSEGLSYALYDQPSLVHDIMEFHADFLIEAARPVLECTTVEYICLNEDLAMKTGPLLSPRAYQEFIFPRLRRVVEFTKSRGARYFCIDTDGNPEPIIPMFLEAGVDVIWPLERAADQDPLRLRSQFGRALRLWGGVDKRVLAQGRSQIEAHLRALIPLIEEGGFIPTVDHLVPPDVSWSNFQFYLECKRKMLCLEF